MDFKRKIKHDLEILTGGFDNSDVSLPPLLPRDYVTYEYYLTISGTMTEDIKKNFNDGFFLVLKRVSEFFFYQAYRVLGTMVRLSKNNIRRYKECAFLTIIENEHLIPGEPKRVLRIGPYVLVSYHNIFI